MEFFGMTACLDQWLVFVMLGASGFAASTVPAKQTTAPVF